MKNITSFQLSNNWRNRVTRYFEMEKETLGKNKVAGYSEMEDKAIRKNRVTKHSEKRERIEKVNRDMFEVSFFNQGIIKYN